eukprot:scaffold109693_cov24-Phaeocystis_antarctica.AAC.1
MVYHDSRLLPGVYHHGTRYGVRRYAAHPRLVRTVVPGPRRGAAWPLARTVRTLRDARVHTGCCWILSLSRSGAKVRVKVGVGIRARVRVRARARVRARGRARVG